MGESFEARLIASSSQETFKKAKHILKYRKVIYKKNKKWYLHTKYAIKYYE